MTADPNSLMCPPPQADRISVVSAVVDAIAAGCTTAESIADAIDMTGRQGSYYPSAAWRLGFVEPDRGTSPITWTLTTAGEDLVAAAGIVRVEILISALVELEDLQTYLEVGGGDTLAEQWAAGYSPETVQRRLQTISAWAEFLTAETDDQCAALDAAAVVTRERAPEAKLRTEAHAIAVARPKTPPVTYGAVCQSCFMTKPLSGHCPNCD